MSARPGIDAPGSSAQALRSARRGFSLVEMLLAVFILGIGVISIAALFPAGITLQRQAADDTIGPLVAKNAFATLRSKLSQSDFGDFDDFGAQPSFIPGEGPAGSIQPVGAPSWLPLPSGDWGWMRPAFYTRPGSATSPDPILGTIDVFSADYTRQQGPFNIGSRFTPAGVWATEMPNGIPTGGTPIALFGIPYNRQKFQLFDLVLNDPSVLSTPPFNNLNVQALSEPNITFTQAERSFPQGASVTGRPSYYWDVMFRRYGGKVQVAVFVYRVSAPGGEPADFRVRALSNAQLTGTPAAPTGSFFATASTPPIPALYLAPVFGTAAPFPDGTPTVSNQAWPYRAGTVGPPSTMTALNGYTVPTGSPPPTDQISGTHRGTPFAPELIWDDWQLPNSWWIDNHGTVHKVLQGRTRAGTASSTDSGQGPVRLLRPIPILPASPANSVAPQLEYVTDPPDPTVPTRVILGPNAFIQGIWYVPQRDSRGNILTPVYAAVEEL